MTFNRSRRELCTAAAAFGLFPAFGAASAADTLPMKMVLLGTAGGPRPRKTRSAPAQAILVGDRTYVVDYGDGVARQMVLADIPLDSLRGVFITHQHSDHTADYGNLLLLAWTAGLRTRVDCRGPRPLEKMTKLFFQMNAADIHAEAVPDARHTVWEKFTYLAPFAAFTGAARLPIGPLWSDDYIKNMFLDAVVEVANVARAHGIKLPDDHRDRVHEYAIKLPASTRSSLLIDLQQGKRIEVEALQGKQFIPRL